jgi:hypothetical protein
MNELRLLLESLSPADRRALLWRARYLYARRHPRLIAIYGTLAGGVVFPVLALVAGC